MKPIEAEKLLGGYATGTLTEAERQILFTAALDHQPVFDALADEEALRELLSDPGAKAQLLAALAPAAPPKVVPFWRRMGVLGAAASLILAATAGLAYLRNPDKVPSPAQETAKAPAAKVDEPPAKVGTSATTAQQRAPSEKAKGFRVAESAPALLPPVAQGAASSAAGAPAPALQESTPMKAQMDLRRAEAQERVAKKTEAARPAASAVVEVVAATKDASA